VIDDRHRAHVLTFTLVASAANPKPDSFAAAKELRQGKPVVVVGNQLRSVDESQVAQLATAPA